MTNAEPSPSAASTPAHTPPPQPVKIERLDAKRLAIGWSDGVTLHYSISEIRKQCPCATCKEKHNAAEKNPFQLTILKPEETIPLAVIGMKPVGAYAYAIDFSDGHNTGIYTFEFLRALGESVKEST